ncbi:MAG: fumarylacetoacetate hydrolase family protein [Propionibacteriales bacterium]|nr:fumarylacetoacetate hydrolase family protein [Propionibacteriales bacterium]
MINDDVLPTRPGKIIAVHLSYASRAEQRGRTPEAPSYFFKPTSSLAPSGGMIERPAGTELLAFEGEIALVIRNTARHVSLDQAWSHVGWVTAANDFGLYDLRANDKGSNVRSKGGDGFTPLGPALLEAADLDPTALRVRTWVNGNLVQDDTTAGLIFPLAQIVADLSQHLTLEPGDVILTGTPAGSSVVVPGDVVEVEVDDCRSLSERGTSASKRDSTGRLVTTVVEGGGPAFDPKLGSLPAVDDQQRTEAWGSADAAGLPAATTVDHGLSDELRTTLMRVPVASLSQQLRKHGLNNVAIDGVRSNHPDAKLVGTARTLRFVPNREDLFKTHGGGHNAQKRAFDAVGEGEVLIIEARGDATAGTLGDILAIRARSRGAAGIVTDGAVRDADAVAAVGIPVYAAGAHPAVLGRRHVPWDHDLTIACGGATVQPGDIIVGDADGVIVIPPGLAQQVADEALAKEDEDAWVAQQIADGHPIEGLFPMNAEWRAKFVAERGGSEQ